jgi:hypothetical protein
MNKFWKVSGLVAVLALGLAQKSSAVVSTTIYNFTGTCSDCAGTGTATLTVLASYTLGTALSNANVVSFTYNGTNLTGPFTITPSSPNFVVVGSISSYPGRNNVAISSTLSITDNFTSSTNGQWFVGQSDEGTVSIWGTALPPATPAPSTSLLVTIGLALLAAFTLWRRRRIA